jgi:hypothetical protein
MRIVIFDRQTMTQTGVVGMRGANAGEFEIVNNRCAQKLAFLSPAQSLANADPEQIAIGLQVALRELAGKVQVKPALARFAEASLSTQYEETTQFQMVLIIAVIAADQDPGSSTHCPVRTKRNRSENL